MHEACGSGRPAGKLPGLAVEQRRGCQVQGRQRRLGARGWSALRAQPSDTGCAHEPGLVLPAADRRDGQRCGAGPCHGRDRWQPGRLKLCQPVRRLHGPRRKPLCGRRHCGQRLLGPQPTHDEWLFNCSSAVLFQLHCDGGHQPRAAAGPPCLRHRLRMVAIRRYRQRGRFLPGRRRRGQSCKRPRFRRLARHQHGNGGFAPHHGRRTVEAG